jgi:3-hydroxybutyrate dehydrogenase
MTTPGSKAVLGNKSVFVTGSDRGIGKAIALAFAGAGARVAVHGLATPDEAKAVVQENARCGQPGRPVLRRRPTQLQ